MRRILAAVAVLALLLLAGCAGVRSDEPSATATGRPPGADEVRLIVSQDLGASILTDVTAPAADDLSVMRLLAEHTKVETQYGGGFVQSIDGLASTYGSVSDADAKDWFYWIDGIMADVGAGDLMLQGGETIWWDHHSWARAMYLPTAVAAFPAPWAGDDLPLMTSQDEAALQEWAAAQGLTLGAARPLTSRAPAAGVIVATAAEALKTPWLRARIAGQDGGVKLMELRDGTILLRALDGEMGPAATGVCLALPNPEDGDRPLFLLLVREPSDLASLLASVTPETVSARLGIAVVEEAAVTLPWALK